MFEHAALRGARAALALATGCAYAGLLAWSLQQMHVHIEPRAPGVRVTMRVAPPAFAPRIVTELPLATERAPAAARLKRAQARPANPPVRTATPETPALAPNLSEFEPSMLDEAAVPPAPEAPALIYTDAPNGDVLVLGLLVDHTGAVLDTRVLVASRHALEDLTFALAMRGQHFSRVEPPLAPGQTRWVQARIPYRASRAAALP